MQSMFKGDIKDKTARRNLGFLCTMNVPAGKKYKNNAADAV